MSLHYRYPGARPFNAEEASIFFGRSKEVDLLFQRVREAPLLILYGKTGLGKSSLLSAGLVPKIKKSKEYLPFSIRFGALESELGKMPLDTVREQLKADAPLLDRLHKEKAPSLWSILKAQQLAQPSAKGSLLIFDQFEELFTYPPEAVEAFMLQLSEVLNTSVPDRFQQGIERLLQVGDQSITAKELSLLRQPFRVSVILAVRSDRLDLLDRLQPFLPSILDHTYELSSLSPQQATDAILNPALESNGFESPMFDYEDAAVDHLINFLSADQKQDIASFQLQVLCEHVEQSLVIKEGKTLILESDLSDPQRILENYYMRKVAQIKNKKERLAARKLMEEGLIYEEEERRLNLYKDQIEKSFGVSSNLLDRLVDTHLLRAEPSLKGGYTYELAHDALVGPVLQAKAERQQVEARQQDERDRQEHRAELAEERRKRQRARRVAAIMSIVAVLAVAVSIIPFIQARSVKTAKEKMEIRMQETEETLREVGQMMEAGRFSMARQRLEEALQEIDSADIRLLNRLDSLKRK